MRIELTTLGLWDLRAASCAITARGPKDIRNYPRDLSCVAQECGGEV